MSEREEQQGFVIRDRRGRGGEESAASTSSAAPTQPERSETQATPAPDEERVPITFSSFVFSLGTSALMLMGESLDPRQPSPPMNLPQAKEIIDILSVLEEKTHGNLSSEEESVLRDMLYTLRMKYVSLTSSKSSL